MFGQPTYAAVEELLAENDHDELPEGWSGGEAHHTGGNIWSREFTHESREYQVAYSLNESMPGVGIQKVEEQDDGYLEPVMLVENTQNGPRADAEKFAVALAKMEEFDPDDYE